MSSKLQVSEVSLQLQNSSKLELAKRQLSLIEQKFKKFNNKSREHTQKHTNHLKSRKNSQYLQQNSYKQEQRSFVPDLKQYFSFMMEKQNQSIKDNMQNPNRKQNNQKPSASFTKYKEGQKISYEVIEANQKKLIEQKIIQKKSEAIANLQNFFINKKSQLQAKIAQLEYLKEKALLDISLLKRNNVEIQAQIQFERNFIFTDVISALNEKNQAISDKIEKKRSSIETLKKNIEKTIRRKQTLKKNISDCLKGNKNLMIHSK